MPGCRTPGFVAGVGSHDLFKGHTALKGTMLILGILLTTAGFVVSLAVTTGYSNGNSPADVVDLGYSQYQGVRLQAGVDQYLGMRYAAAPLGDLRFRAPADPDTTSEVQYASKFGPLCVGTGQSVSSGLSDDCLFINVFAPANATSTSKLPVWFYIQGGGYATNSNPNYNGTNVVVQSGHEIVFVNFNYRVGAHGFLAGEEVRQNGDLNAGLLDQRKALEWVQKYIHLFGGDPDHVVIHGTSAGAGSVAYHLTAYGGRDDGLFAGAVGESVFFPTHRTVEDSEFQFDRFVELTGCSGSTDHMACLRSKDIATIQNANVAHAFPGATDSPLPLWYFLPVIDGDFSQNYLSVLFEQGKLLKVPIIFGDDTNEGSYFAYNAETADDVSNFLRNNYPGLTDEQLAQINSLYPLQPPVPNHSAYFPSASDAYGDSTFVCPGNRISRAMTEYFSEDSVWNYRYNVVDQENVAAGIGVPHTYEIPAIFGIGYVGSTGVGSAFETYNAPIIPLVMNYWLSFVKYLDPNPGRLSGAPLWKNFGKEDGKRLKFELNATRVENVPADQAEKCALWKELAITMEQ